MQIIKRYDIKEKMLLDICHYHQEKSLTCGLAALRMIMGYFKDLLTEKDLAKNIKMHNAGTFLTDLGVFALNRGYKTTSYTFHLPLLSPLKISFGTKIKKNHLQNITPRPSDKTIFESWKSYLAQGGELIWQFPQVNLIKNWIDRKIPCLININTAALNLYWRNWDNGHSLVVNGLNKTEVMVLNPDLPEKKARYTIKYELFLPSWSINAKRSSGYLMVVEKV